MATTTTKLGLIKPATSEFQDVATVNTNMNTIDAQFVSSTGTFAYGAADWVTASVYTPIILRVGPVCTLVGTVTKNSGFTTGVTTVVGNIPFGYRPSTNIRMIVMAANGAGAAGRPFYLVVDSVGGDLSLFTPTDAGLPVFNTNTWIHLNITWLAP